MTTFEQLNDQLVVGSKESFTPNVKFKDYKRSWFKKSTPKDSLSHP